MMQPEHGITSDSISPRTFAPTLAVLTFARLVLNCTRRFPYIVLTPMATVLGVPRSTLEAALSIQWGVGAFSPLSGPYIDRFGRKRIMILGLGVLVVLSILGTFGSAAWVILLAVVGLGFTKNLFDPALQAYVADRTPYRWRGMAIGITELAWSASLFVIGPLAAFLIVQSVNAIYAVIAAGSVIALGLLIVVLPNDKPAPHQTDSKGRSGFALLRATPAALGVLSTAMCISLAIESISIVYESWLRDTFALRTIDFGGISWLISAAEVSAEVFVIAFSDRIGKRRLLIAACLGAGCAFFVFPLTGGSLLAAQTALFLIFFAFEISIVVLVPLATEALPQARGTMMSTNVAALAIGRAIGSISGGWMFRSLGLGLNGTIAMLLNVVAALLIWRFVVEHPQTQAAVPLTD